MHDSKRLAYTVVLRIGGLLLCLGSSCGIVHAQEQQAATAPAIEDQDRYQFQVNAGAWLPRLGGENSDDILVEEEFDLDSSEAVLNIEFIMRKNDYWQLDISGFDFETSNSGEFTRNADFFGTELDFGDPYRADFEMTSAAVELAWWMWEYRRIGEVRGRKTCRLDLRFAPLVGVRYLDIEQSLETPAAGRVELGGEWLAPFAGLDIQMRYDTLDTVPLVDMLEINGSMALGPVLGGDGGMFAHIRAGVTAHFNDTLAFTFGYRLLQVDVENEPYEFQGGLQGLFIGGTFRF